MKARRVNRAIALPVDDLTVPITISGRLAV